MLLQNQVQGFAFSLFFVELKKLDELFVVKVLHHLLRVVLEGGLADAVFEDLATVDLLFDRASGD